MYTIYQFDREIRLTGKDYNFIVYFYNEFQKGWAYEFEGSNCDAHMKLTRSTGKQRVTVLPFTNIGGFLLEGEEKAVEGVFSKEFADKLFDRFASREVNTFWFAQDIIRYAEKHGKII